jgi:hypothetical protein
MAAGMEQGAVRGQPPMTPKPHPRRDCDTRVVGGNCPEGGGASLLPASSTPLPCTSITSNATPSIRFESDTVFQRAIHLPPQHLAGGIAAIRKSSRLARATILAGLRASCHRVIGPADVTPGMTGSPGGSVRSRTDLTDQDDELEYRSGGLHDAERNSGGFAEARTTGGGGNRLIATTAVTKQVAKFAVLAAEARG